MEKVLHALLMHLLKATGFLYLLRENETSDAITPVNTMPGQDISDMATYITEDYSFFIGQEFY